MGRCRLAAAAGVLLLVAAAAGCDGGRVVYSGEPMGRIAFSTARGGDGEIYVMNADGSEQENLTRDPAQDFEPSWSADGKRIAFTSTRGEQQDIWIMDADGRNPKRVTDSLVPDGQARWSPDGTRLAFYSVIDQARGLLWVMDVDGGEPVPLLEEITPSFPETACGGGFPGGWFPDGERVLFRGGQGNIGALQICSVKDDGSDIRVIYSEKKVMSFFPALSADGRRIAFVSDRDGNPEIYVMDSGGKGRWRVTNDDGTDTNATWSPDGQWIAFASDRDGDFDIYIVRPDGSDLRKLTDNDAEESSPSWSPLSSTTGQP